MTVTGPPDLRSVSTLPAFRSGKSSRAGVSESPTPSRARLSERTPRPSFSTRPLPCDVHLLSFLSSFSRHVPSLGLSPLRYCRLVSRLALNAARRGPESDTALAPSLFLAWLSVASPHRRLHDRAVSTGHHKVVVVGAGSAGVSVANMLVSRWRLRALSLLRFMLTTVCLFDCP